MNMAENIVLLNALLNRLDTVLVIVCVLCAFVVIQIVAKVIIFGRVIEVMKRCELLLNMAEMHAKITDSQKERTVDAVEQMHIEAKRVAAVAAVVAKESVQDVKQAVEEVPKKVVEEIQKIDGPHSGPSTLTTNKLNKRPTPEG